MNYKCKLTLVLLTLSILLSLIGSASADSHIDWHVLAAGAEQEGSSTNYQVAGTAFQPGIETGSSTNFTIIGGFWQDFSDDGEFECGDINLSGDVDIDDIMYLVHWIFGGGPAPSLMSVCDVNCSGDVDIDDIIYMIHYIFSGGPNLCDPDSDGVPDC
jgi:hypothetical protein